jgi:hypothetical protein
MGKTGVSGGKAQKSFRSLGLLLQHPFHLGTLQVWRGRNGVGVRTWCFSQRERSVEGNGREVEVGMSGRKKWGSQVCYPVCLKAGIQHPANTYWMPMCLALC